MKKDRMLWRFWSVRCKCYVLASSGDWAYSSTVCTWKADGKDVKQYTMEKPEDLIPEQYTGLNDKDGNPIYEGDVVEFDNGYNIISATITYDETALRWVAATPSNTYSLSSMFNDKMMIVGNIHERD